MSTIKNKVVDVLIVGDGIAGCYAALAARALGANILMIEKAQPKRSSRKYCLLWCDHSAVHPKVILQRKISPTSSTSREDRQTMSSPKLPCVKISKDARRPI